MGNDIPLPLIIILLGPTASGKTALSLQLAKQFCGEIVSCDSVAVYREIEVGTAKPSLDERRETPHHLIDIINLSDIFTAGDYSRLARAALADISARQKIPIVTGGTGLYLRALIDGLFPAPQRSEKIRHRLRTAGAAKGPGWLHRILTRLDPDAAQQIHANDVPKVIRAIEVCLTAGQSMTQAWQAGRDALQGFQVLRVGLNPDRRALYDRINQRAAAMFEIGLVEETRRLADKYGPGARPLTSLGYKQAIAHINGEMNLKEAVASAQKGHRHYAKRQMTWFRREPEVHWLNGFGDEDKIRQEVQSLIAASLAVTTPER